MRVLNDSFWKHGILFLDVPFREISQALYISFLKETVKSSGREPKSQAKLSASGEDASVNVAGNCTE